MHGGILSEESKNRLRNFTIAQRFKLSDSAFRLKCYFIAIIRRINIGVNCLFSKTR